MHMSRPDDFHRRPTTLGGNISQLCVGPGRQRLDLSRGQPADAHTSSPSARGTQNDWCALGSAGAGWYNQYHLPKGARPGRQQVLLIENGMMHDH